LLRATLDEGTMNFDEALGHVEETLREALASDIDLLSGSSKYLVGAGGKRLRPRVVLLSFQACGGSDFSRVMSVAAAVELLHTASLVHDDINDRSGTRRGRPTANATWGDGLALLIGDYVFVKLLKLVATCETALLQVFAQACVDIVEGETEEALSLGDLALSEARYLQIVSGKTASLFATSAEMGAMLAQASEEERGALREYGQNLGMAFQLRDDTLDVTGSSPDLGKPVGSDFAQGKLSLATIFARGKLGGEQDALGSHADRVVEILREVGALEYARLKATEYAEKAKGALLTLDDSDARARLTRLADFAVSRNR
jgi:octaprenyl-diphosphate synthase